MSEHDDRVREAYDCMWVAINQIRNSGARSVFASALTDIRNAERERLKWARLAAAATKYEDRE